MASNEHHTAFTGVMKITVVRAENLKPPQAAAKKAVDPYIIIQLDNKVIAKTQAKAKTENPIFEECFEATANRATCLELVAMSRATMGDGFLASLKVPLSECIDGAGGSSELWVSCSCDPEKRV